MSVIISKFVSCHDRTRVGKSSTVGNGRGHETRGNLRDGRTLNRVKGLFSINILKITLNLPGIVVLHGDGNTGEEGDTGASNGNGIDRVVCEHGVTVVGKLDTEPDDTSGCGSTIPPGGNGVGEDDREFGFGGVRGNHLREDVKGEFGVHIIKIGIMIWG